MAEEPQVADRLSPEVAHVNSDTYATLASWQKAQVDAVADVLVKAGAYTGSRLDAVTDAAAIVLAMQFSPTGDNHHNAAMCPYCTPRPKAECTGITASWCPVHGDCTCPEGREGIADHKGTINRAPFIPSNRSTPNDLLHFKEPGQQHCYNQQERKLR